MYRISPPLQNIIATGQRPQFVINYTNKIYSQDNETRENVPCHLGVALTDRRGGREGGLSETVEGRQAKWNLRRSTCLSDVSTALIVHYICLELPLFYLCPLLLSCIKGN